MKFEWGWCELCDCSFVYCPKCGNNGCNGGYGKINGKQCDVCELAYQYQHLAWETKKSPTKKLVEKNPPKKVPHWFDADCKRIAKIIDMPKEEKLKHIQEHPEEHKHCYNELIGCCFIGEAVDEKIMEAHGKISGYNVPQEYYEKVKIYERIVGDKNDKKRKN